MVDPRTAALTGLTTAEVSFRVETGQSNAFHESSSRSAWSIFRANVLTLFNAIIGGCFLLLLVLGKWQDALFGLAALANVVIGSVQEFRAKRALDRLALVHAPHATVIRDGMESEIAGSDVVLDDLLAVRPGDQLPADARVLRSFGLQLDESMLTGESDPVDKLLHDELLSGSFVVAGHGLATVHRVGGDSYANQFASEAKRFSLMRSELRSSVNRVLRWITWSVGPITLLLLNAQMISRGGWVDAIRTGLWRDAAVSAIASVTAMIPQGIVLMTSIAFAVGALKLARRQVLTQELAAVEGLARVDVICLDKTGTLTEGEIVFDAVHPLAAEQPQGWEQVLGWYGVQPDANATARCLAAAFVEYPSDAPRAVIPFSSARKWNAVAFGDGPAGSWVLGAPDIVFHPASHPAMAAQLTEFAAHGRRTLVFAYSPEPFGEAAAGAAELPDGLVPMMLITFREQLREDAAETLAYFARQGVQVRIISGDDPATVAAIAREVGLDAPDGVDARELPEDDDALAELLETSIVFGRVTPQQKKRLVLALQSRHHTVAMTGDGVNDALAIKTADIGIAMGSGSPATRAVARMVLLDGRFSHLPKVVDEGRQVIANIERVSMLFFTKTVFATALAIAFGVLLMAFPLLPRQLSLTDGLTLGIPAFFLALLPNTPRYNPGFLRRSLSFAIPAGLVIAAAITTYTRLAAAQGASTSQLGTGATLLLGILGLWVLIVLSRPISRVKAAIAGAMVVGLVAGFTVPFVRAFFLLVDIGPTQGILTAAVAAAGVAAIEIVRLVRQRILRGPRPDPDPDHRV
ncbi:HAD-IC family P-type ATPase [Gryllotalpicola sp.]|uniref:HAD-IC family P-type ATPase n=1 Tax=Gryllotalpicola sp. TaxID=1932787 RepID=UPI002610B0A4|nr:HAD-IC family P-type ATPase [Gryllotalpicola sp.]